MDVKRALGERTFDGLDLGDVRRTRRLVDVFTAMCRHPGGTLPAKMNKPKRLRAFYRLMNRDEVTHEALMASHAKEARRRIAAVGVAAAGAAVGELKASGPAAFESTRIEIANVAAGELPTVLILHDGTELDYSTLKALRSRLGQIGQGTGHGYICHNSLAVRAQTGESLGLTSQILHHRVKVAKKETAKQSRERTSRESLLWLQGAEASGPAPAGVRCVDVCDSLADTFEFMAYEVTHNRHFVIRAKENRKLAEPLADKAAAGEEYLLDALRKLPSAGTRSIKVLTSSGRKGRDTTVCVSFSKVRIAPPHEKWGNYADEPLDLWAVRVWEPNTPAGEEPLEWILLTNCPVTTLDDAQERVDWYEKRWIIEEYHKGMKTGCGIETMQFDTIEALEPAIALISIVATTLLSLRDAARAADAATRPATEVVDPIYVAVLVACSEGKMSPTPSVKEFYMHVARLGGHQNRKCDGLPGWITLWRGWMLLLPMVDGFQAARLGHTTRCGKN